MPTERSVDIFVRSYRGDFPWLEHCLKSIHRFAKGFSSVHIVVPEADKPLLASLTEEIVHGTVDECDGYLAQQVTKLYADEFCGADYVLHVDSDCVFQTEFSPDNFFFDNKPILLREDNVGTHWIQHSANFLGWQDTFEYMRRLPIIYPLWIYKEFREWMESRHGVPLRSFICNQDKHSFSEFNTLGMWAYKFHQDKFSWKHPQEVPAVAKQYWSWGGIEKHIPELQSAGL